MSCKVGLYRRVFFIYKLGGEMPSTPQYCHLSNWSFAPRNYPFSTTSFTLELKESLLTKPVMAQTVMVSGYFKYGNGN